MSAEQWLPIPGWEGEYSASTHGRVRSDERVVVRGNGASFPVVERILRPDPLGRITLSRNGVQYRFNGSELIAEAFGTAQ